MIDYRNGTKGNGMEISNMQATGYTEWTGDRVHILCTSNNAILLLRIDHPS